MPTKFHCLIFTFSLDETVISGISLDLLGYITNLNKVSSEI
ncbi:MAG: hypothetical protein N2490_03680 [Ignavibacteria bacterium]|nr:hypothetical protein [Ignavibacteria bacterium]